MKKNLALVLVLALVMAVAVVAFAACGGQTYEGEYKYANTYNDGGDNPVLDDYYGVRVKVTVTNNIITKVEVTPDTDKFFNLSAGWADKAKWEQGAADMIESFEGRTVEEIKAIKVAVKESGAIDTDDGVSTITNAPASLKVVTGATQSAGRLILAVQNALSKIDAAK